MQKGLITKKQYDKLPAPMLDGIIKKKSHGHSMGSAAKHKHKKGHKKGLVPLAALGEGRLPSVGAAQLRVELGRAVGIG
jgi:hypothetical protein